jgi:hypothetical protein
LIWNLRPIFLSLPCNYLDICGVFQYGAPSLTIGCVYNLRLLLGLTSADCLGSEFRGTHDHTLLSQLLRLPELRGAGFCICYPSNSVDQFDFQAFNLINLHVICTGIFLVQNGYGRLCPIKSSSGYNCILLTLTGICLTVSKFNPLIFSVLGFAFSNISEYMNPPYFELLVLVACIIWLYNRIRMEFDKYYKY